MEVKFPATVQPISELEKNTKLIGQFKAKAPLNKLVFGTKLNTTFKDSLTGRQYAKASVTCESTTVASIDPKSGTGLAVSTGLGPPRPVVKMGADEFDENGWVHYLCNAWKNGTSISYNDIYTSLMELKVLIEKRCFHEVNDKEITVHYKVMAPVMKNAFSQTEESLLADNNFSTDCITVDCELLSPEDEPGSDVRGTENSEIASRNPTVDSHICKDKNERLTNSVAPEMKSLDVQSNTAKDPVSKNPEAHLGVTTVKVERPSPGADIENAPPTTNETTSGEQHVSQELTNRPLAESKQSMKPVQANKSLGGINLPSNSVIVLNQSSTATTQIPELKREPSENSLHNGQRLPRCVIEDSGSDSGHEFPNRTSAVSNPGTSTNGLLSLAGSNPKEIPMHENILPSRIPVESRGSGSENTDNNETATDTSETSSMVTSVESVDSGLDSSSANVINQNNPVTSSSSVSVSTSNSSENSGYIRAAPRKTIKTKPKLIRARNDLRSADTAESSAANNSTDASPQTPTHAEIQKESSIRVSEVSSVARLRSDALALAAIESSSGTNSRSEEQCRREKSPSPKLQQIPLKRSPVSPSGKQGRTTTTTIGTEPAQSKTNPVSSNSRSESPKVSTSSPNSACGNPGNPQAVKRKSKAAENITSQSKNGVLRLRQVKTDERSTIQVFEVLNLGQIRSSMESVVQPTRYFPCSVCTPLPVRTKGLKTSNSKHTENPVSWSLYPKNPKLYPPINIYKGTDLIKYQVEIARYSPQLNKKVSNLECNSRDDEINCLYLIRVIPECDLEFCVKVNSLSEDVAKFRISDNYSLIVNLNEVKNQIDLFPGVIVVKSSSASHGQNHSADPCSAVRNRKRPLSSDRSQQPPKQKSNEISKSSTGMPVAVKKSTVSEPTTSEALASSYEDRSPPSTSTEGIGCQGYASTNQMTENPSTSSFTDSASTKSVSNSTSTTTSPGKSFARKSLVRNVVPNRDVNHNRSDMRTQNPDSGVGSNGASSIDASNATPAKRLKKENDNSVGSDEELKRANSCALRELNAGSFPDSGQATLERHLELGCKNCEQKEASGFVHRCRFCTEHFITIKSLRHHLFDYHKRFICVPCGAKFSKEIQLREHVLRCS